MTHTPSPALSQPPCRSECFAEDLGEGGTSRPSGQVGTRWQRLFPFPIAPYPQSPLDYDGAAVRPASARLASSAQARSLRNAVAWMAIAAALLPASASAAIVSYIYSGVVDSDDAGRGWSTFSGQITFESTTPDSIPDPSTADYKVSAALNGNWPNGMNVIFDSVHSVSFNNYFDILVSNNLGGADQWGAQAHDSGSDDSLGLTLADFSQGVFSSDALPLQVGGLTLAMFTMSEFKYESAGGLLNGHLTGLRCVVGCEGEPSAAVSEPHSLALALAGLGAMGLRARRRRLA
jgi:MYXO-CTERM domain-containing protein